MAVEESCFIHHVEDNKLKKYMDKNSIYANYMTKNIESVPWEIVSNIKSIIFQTDRTFIGII